MSGIRYFDIYGTESHQPSDPEFLHVERMGARAKELKGRAAPHVHKHLFQFLFSLSGDCVADVEGVKQQITAPSALYIPSGTLHSFTFAEDSSGWIVTGSNRSFGHDAADSGQAFLGAIWQAPALIDYGSDAAGLENLSWLLTRLEIEFKGSEAGRAHALENLIRLVFIDFRRRLATTENLTLANSGDRKLFLDFRLLFEQQYREHWSVQAYASKLGVRAVRLNKACRKFTDKTAHELVQGRLLLESQRLLIYTVATAAEIAFDLGFQDPAYFNRFFRRAMGVTPLQFRARKQQEKMLA